MHKLLIGLAMLAAGLAGCAATEKPGNYLIGRTPALVTPADVRVITERRRPTWDSSVLCAEPSPDIAKAISTMAKLSGSYGGASAGGAVSTAESISILAGRTAGVVALRDGCSRPARLTPMG